MKKNTFTCMTLLLTVGLNAQPLTCTVYTSSTGDKHCIMDNAPMERLAYINVNPLGGIHLSSNSSVSVYAQSGSGMSINYNLKFKGTSE